MVSGALFQTPEVGVIPNLTASYGYEHPIALGDYLGASPVGQLGGHVDRSRAPLSELPRQVVSAETRTFLTDYYNRFYVIPPMLKLGSVAKNMEVVFYIWNAHLTPRVSGPIDSNGSEGLSILAPPNATSYRRVEHKQYRLVATPNGPAMIGAKLQFTFNESMG